MNKFLLVPFLTALSSVPLFAGAGTGPWALGAYYPGQLDGKYQASVSGNNITGVVGFAIVNGGLPFASRSSAAGGGTTTGGGATTGTSAASVNTDLVGVDETQNYFAIFVEGRTYTGRTVGMIDINRKKVTGTLIGLQPPFSYQELTIGQALVVGTPPDQEVVTSETVVPIADNLPLLNRGLSGGFTANLKNTKNLMTFKGTGELATPAQKQTITADPSTFPVPALDPARPDIIISGFTPRATSATIETDTVCFNVYGIKTSILATDPLASTGTAATGAN
jgi:hypothetical protein